MSVNPLKVGDILYQAYRHKNGNWKIRKGRVIESKSFSLGLGILIEDQDNPSHFFVHAYTGANRFGAGPWYTTILDATQTHIEVLKREHENELIEIRRLIPVEEQLTNPALGTPYKAVESNQVKQPGEIKTCSAQPPASTQ